jgi:hypothetical protein
MFEGITCVYRSNIDLFFYVFGASTENEVRAPAQPGATSRLAIALTLLLGLCQLLLFNVLNSYYEAIAMVVK